MTGDAFFETVLLVAYTFQHGFITLVLEDVHVVTAHEIGVFYATIALSHGDCR